VDERVWLAERFEQNRGRLRAVAYRMLGSLWDADDAVQETWLRLSSADTRGVANLNAWLTTIIARVCLNMLSSRQSRREDSIDVRVLERQAAGEDSSDPEQQALLADSVGVALLVILGTLPPAEGLAFGHPGHPAASGGARVCFARSFRGFHSTRSPPFSSVLQWRRASLRVAHAAACVERPRLRPTMHLVTEKSSLRFWQRLGVANSIGCWCYLTPTSRSAPTAWP
jgi:RNA polymerase sigma factor (sigma-70 family)